MMIHSPKPDQKPSFANKEFYVFLFILITVCEHVYLCHNAYTEVRRQSQVLVFYFYLV